MSRPTSDPAGAQPTAGSPRQLVSSPADRDRRRRGSRILRPGYRRTETAWWRTHGLPPQSGRSPRSRSTGAGLAPWACAAVAGAQRQPRRPPHVPAGRLVFGIFAALAEFKRELIRERTVAGLKAARARGRKGGRKFALSKAQVRLAQAAMAHRDTSVSELCRELGIRPVTLYRYVGPQGQLREQGQKVLAS